MKRKEIFFTTILILTIFFMIFKAGEFTAYTKTLEIMLENEEKTMIKEAEEK